MPQSSTLRVLDLDSFRPRYFSNRNQSWYAGASQAAEKLPSEGGGGFNPRIKPAELEPALAADGLSLRFQWKSRVFPQPLQPLRYALRNVRLKTCLFLQPLHALRHSFFRRPPQLQDSSDNAWYLQIRDRPKLYLWRAPRVRPSVKEWVPHVPPPRRMRYGNTNLRKIGIWATL